MIMKRTYIKPEIEILDSELEGFLCESITRGIDGEIIGGNGNNNSPDGAREFDGGFIEDEDF